jgi:hypothetical protein
MGKIGWPILIALCAAVAADEYFNYGRHTESTIATLRQVQTALGW